MSERSWEDNASVRELELAAAHVGSGLVNDLADVLTVVLGNAELMRARCKVLADEGLDESCQEILQAADRGTALIAHYFAFTRRQLEPSFLIELNSLVAELEPALVARVGPGVRVIFGLCPHDVEIVGDPRQLAQVILNLAGNARDAMPDGGELDIALDVTNLESSLDVRGRMLPSGPYAVVTLRDHGGAMSAALCARGFEPYFTTKGSRHVGLGLYHADHIVRQHGGAIFVDTLSAGSRIRVLLPRTVHQPAAS